MTINNLSSTSLYQTGQTNYQSSFKQNFQQLGDAISSGNLTDASSALATIMKGLPNGTSSSTTNPMTADLQTLQTAIQSGDVTSAQKALATLQQDMKSVHGHHHHGHKPSTDQSSSTTTTSATSSTTSSLQDFLTSIGSMQSAVSSGNITDAQSIFSSMKDSSSSTSPISSNSQTNQNLQALQSALNSGDVNSAQSSFASIIQSLQSSFDGAIGNIVDVKS